jgi:hypothetical protein
VTSTFAYNPASQIVSNERSNSAYSFVPAPASVAATHNGLNQVATSGGQAATYDAHGNLASEGGRTFVYSSENMLTAMTGGGRNYTFAYDPLMRLQLVTAIGLADRSYVWDGNDAIVTG